MEWLICPGKMKSREGTVVDADDLIEQMKNTAGRIAAENGKIEDLKSKREILFQKIGLGALKYFILKVIPRRGFYLTLKPLLILTEILVHLFNIHMLEFNHLSNK